MSDRITLEQTEDVPADSRVCHYDELDEAAKEQFPQLTADDRAEVDADAVDGLQRCDLVKFTDYYEVSVQCTN